MTSYSYDFSNRSLSDLQKTAELLTIPAIVIQGGKVAYANVRAKKFFDIEYLQNSLIRDLKISDNLIGGGDNDKAFTATIMVGDSETTRKSGEELSAEENEMSPGGMLQMLATRNGDATLMLIFRGLNGNQIEAGEESRIHNLMLRLNHTLRNSLANMNSQIILLRKSIERNEAQEQRGLEVDEQMIKLMRLEREYLKMLRTCNNLRDFVRLRNREITFEPSEVNLSRLCAHAAVLASGASDRKVDVQFFQEGGDIAVRADERLLERMMFNLLTNAITHSPEGSAVSLTLSARKSGRPGAGLSENCAHIQLDDNGCGMPLDEDFDPYSAYLRRIDELDYASARAGLGLGLPICREIVRLHGGEMRHLLKKDSGVSFHVFLPLEQGTGEDSSETEGRALTLNEPHAAFKDYVMMFSDTESGQETQERDQAREYGESYAHDEVELSVIGYSRRGREGGK